MKVLMVAHGASIHAQRPLAWLLDSGCEVVFVDRTNPVPNGRTRYRFIPYPRLRGARFLPFAARTRRRLAAWVVKHRLRAVWRRVKPDVVHVHWVDRRAYECAHAGMKPLVLTAWGSDVNDVLAERQDAEGRRAIASALARADVVLVDAAVMAERCAELVGHAVRSEVLVLGIDTTLFAPGHDEAARTWREKLDIAEGATVFLSIRAWGRRYNHDLVLRAFARALPRVTRPAVLVFKVYNPGDYPEAAAYEAEVRALARALGVEHAVRWLEEVPFPQLPEIYACADVVINYPAVDAFPVTFLEAAACERRVITARLPSYRGTFAESSFRMVDPNDVDALAGAIVEACIDLTPEARRALAGVRELVRARFDESVSRRRLLEIYEDLAARRRHGAGVGAGCV